MVLYDGFSIINGFHYMVSQSLCGFHYMVSQSLYGFHYMVSQSSYGSIIWFLNHYMVSIIWFLNHHMVPLYGFSIIIWFPKIWFLNQNLVNYMFPNQTSAFSRYPATDSSKCASVTDSSCFRAIIECITSYDSSVWFKLIVYKVKYSICCLNICRYFLLIIFVCFSICALLLSIFIISPSNGILPIGHCLCGL